VDNEAAFIKDHHVSDYPDGFGIDVEFNFILPLSILPPLALAMVELNWW
jgi:hypothetical protein